jgi:hypothetical protein
MATKAKTHKGARHQPAERSPAFFVEVRGLSYYVVDSATGGIFAVCKDFESAQRRALQLDQSLGRSRR